MGSGVSLGSGLSVGSGVSLGVASGEGEGEGVRLSVAGGVLAGGAEPSASGLPQAASSDRVRAPERARARSFLFILHKLL